MPQVKVQADRHVRIPAHIFAKYRLQQGDILEVRDAGNGIVFISNNRLARNHKRVSAGFILGRNSKFIRAYVSLAQVNFMRFSRN